MRLFGAAQGARTPVQGVTAVLRGYHRRADGTLRRLPGALRPWNRPAPLRADPDLAALRLDPNGAFNFVLPPRWTAQNHELVLEGEIAPRPRRPWSTSAAAATTSLR